MDTRELASIIAGGESQTVEFKESFGEESLETLAAFANSAGGTLLVGVADDGTVKGTHTGNESLRNWANRITQGTGLNPAIGKTHVDGKTVVFLCVEKSPVRPVACAGRYFKRVNNSNRRMTDDDITRIVLDKVGITWDEIEEPRATLRDLDFGALSTFRAECNAKGRRPVPGKDSDKTVLEKLGLFKHGKLIRAALLLFGKAPQSLYPSAILKIGRFRPGGIIADDREIWGTIFAQIEAAMEYFRGRLATRFERKGLPARDVIWEYPLSALREAVTNAICHRDYLDLSQTQIRWHDDRIIVVNPGKLIPPLKPETLLQPHVSRQRNRKIAELLYYTGLVERWGSGILEMSHSCVKAGLPEPRFKEEQGAIWLTFPQTGNTTATAKGSEKSSEKSSEKILAILAVTPEISAAEIAERIGITSRAVEKNLARLKAAGKILRIGPYKGGRWAVVR